MSLAHAILGILHLHPMTGYDLKTQYFDGSIAYFWTADQAQIYRTLDKLAEQGFVSSALEIQEDRPNRKVYSLTDEGRGEFARWIATPQAAPILRDPFLIQVFMARDVPDEALLKLVAEQVAQHQTRLEAYESIPLPPLDAPGVEREVLLQRLTLEMGFRLERAYLDWLELVKQKLSSPNAE